MLRGRSKLFWALVALVAVLVVFYLPSLVAYRYTAGSQNASFLTHPWRSWRFLVAGLTVPGDSRLKTSGAAYQEADQLFRGSDFEVVAARLLYLNPGDAHTFEPLPDGADLSGLPAGLDQAATIVPPFRFVWQIEGTVRRSGQDLIIAMLDYRSGDVLWDVREELPR
jgi:hypothetical protein